MAGPYRILLTTWQHFGAGSIQSVQYLAEGLLERGHDLRVACPADGVLGRRLAARGVPLVDFHFKKGWSLRSARALAALCARERIELVDAQESRDRKAAILARHLLRAPFRLVVTRRQQTASFFLQNTLYALAADRIVAISQGVADDLARRGMPRGRIRVVHTGLAPERVAGDVDPATIAALRGRFGLDGARPVIGVVARRKDQETLLRAAARLDRPLDLLFVGIERDEKLAALEAKLPAGTRAHYTGFVDPVRPYYALLAVMVLTTKAEGLSQALLESMALGVPVITAAVGGTPELVSDGRNGLHYPPGDDAALAGQLTKLLDDEPLRRRLTEEARRTVDTRFTRAHMAERTEQVYAEILDGHEQAGPRSPISNLQSR